MIKENYSLDKTIVISRKYGDPVRISFKFGKNEETGRYEYINYNIVVGY